MKALSMRIVTGLIVLGALFYFKAAWWKVKSFFTRKKKDTHPKNDNLNA